MTNTNTSTQLMDIATRIRGMREILGYSVQKMAAQTEVTEDIYRQYETGSVDLPFSFLHKCAKVFGLEITVLLEGNSAKLSGYTVTRRGKGNGIAAQLCAVTFQQNGDFQTEDLGAFVQERKG